MNELSTPFDFTEEKEVYWIRDKNLRDVLIHLYEWHQLLLNWVCSNLKRVQKLFILKSYTWKTYGDMNVYFWKKHEKMLGS